MKKLWIGVMLAMLAGPVMGSEILTIFTGKTSVNTNLWGFSFGGEIYDFLHLQLEGFKYLSKDAALLSDVPQLDRSDFAAITNSLILKIPIHLLPKLDRLEFIQPYVSAGIGWGVENLASEYLETEDRQGRKGFWSKLRRFSSMGAGVIVKVLPGIGMKLDYRILDLRESPDLGYPGRKFSRLAMGITF